MANPLSRVFDIAHSSPDELEKSAALLQPLPDPRGTIGHLWYKLFQEPKLDRDLHELQKSVYVAYLNAAKRAADAANQDTAVAPAWSAWSDYDRGRGVSDPAGLNFQLLRNLRHSCPPLAAIVNTRKDQVSSFCEPIDHGRKDSSEPGFRIRMTDPKEEATPEDRKNIAMWRQYFSECGFCEPPEDEKPISWQPGFGHFLKQLTEDRLTLDWIAVRRWKSGTRPNQFPIVSFAAVDAGMILKRRREYVDVVDGKVITEEHQRERRNSKFEITLVKVDGPSGNVVEEYNDNEVVTAYANGRTDETAKGYGYVEAEQAVDAINGYVSGLRFNLFRFDKNSLPRGIITVFGKMNDQQLASFKNNWKSMMTGLEKQWTIPILSADPAAGSSVGWTPLDLSAKDMEYSQFMFLLALVLHAVYRIHPEETGFSALSPFRPPLSEASPETNLKYSQDTGLRPLLKWIAQFLNRNILWVCNPTRRYTFEFVGLGDYDKQQDTEQRSAMLQAGLTTPRMQWAELDQEIPEALKEHPAWDFPAPFITTFQMMQQMQQQQQQQDMAEKQMQQQQIQQQMANRQANSEPDEDGEEGQSQSDAPAQQSMQAPQTPNREFSAAGPQASQQTGRQVVIRRS